MFLTIGLTRTEKTLENIYSTIFVNCKHFNLGLNEAIIGLPDNIYSVFCSYPTVKLLEVIMNTEIANPAFLQQCLTHPQELGRFIGDQLPPEQFADFLVSLANSNITRIKPGLREEMINMAIRVFSQVRCAEKANG